jgi:hypothetical protein
MAQQEKVNLRVAPLVQVNWLTDYVGMLHAALLMKPNDAATQEQIAQLKACDAQIARRIFEVQSYLDKLAVGPRHIN